MKVQYGLKDSYKYMLHAEGIKYNMPAIRNANRAGFICAWIALLAIITLIMGCWTGKAFADAVVPDYNNADYCQAIYWAEGGTHTKHPYGILAHYKHTTPLQACINTVAHARRDWNGQGDFIAWLGNRYCPLNSDTDNGTCKNWIPNVTALLKNKRSN